jgi:hypothetical protein
MGTYLTFDDSKTTFSGRAVKSSFICARSLSRSSEVNKKLWKNFFTFLDVSDQKEHILFFPKKYYFITGCFALGPGPGEFRTYVYSALAFSVLAFWLAIIGMVFILIFFSPGDWFQGVLISDLVLIFWLWGRQHFVCPCNVLFALRLSTCLLFSCPQIFILFFCCCFLSTYSEVANDGFGIPFLFYLNA